MYKFCRIIIIIAFLISAFFVSKADYSKSIQKANDNFKQTTYKTEEYFVLATEFVRDMSNLGSKYLTAKNSDPSEEFKYIKYNSNGTFVSYSPAKDGSNGGALLGIGDSTSVIENQFYENLGFIYGPFFKNYFDNNINVGEINYISTHNFLYNYPYNVSNTHTLIQSLEDYNDFSNSKLGSKNNRVQWTSNYKIINNSKFATAYKNVYNKSGVEGIIRLDYNLTGLNTILDTSNYQVFLTNSNYNIMSSYVADSKIISNQSLSDILGNSTMESLKTRISGNKVSDNVILGKNYISYTKIENGEYIIFQIIPLRTFIVSILFRVVPFLFLVILSLRLQSVVARSWNLRKTLAIEVEDLKETEKALEESANVDFLTKLYNRRYMLDRLDNDRRENKQDKFSILMLDIDHFKHVNDTYGHKAGDMVLKEVSGLIKSCVRKSDLVARWGGEELLILLHATATDDGFAVAEKIRKSVEQHDFDIGDQTINITISIGLSLMDYENDKNKILIEADEALYEAKDTGRNKVVVYKKII